MRIPIWFLAPLSGLKIPCCWELQNRSQMQLRIGSGIAVAVVQAGSCSSDCTPSLGTSTGFGCGPKKKKGGGEWKKVTEIWRREKSFSTNWSVKYLGAKYLARPLLSPVGKLNVTLNCFVSKWFLEKRLANQLRTRLGTHPGFLTGK